jgi:hypothetical protein
MVLPAARSLRFIRPGERSVLRTRVRSPPAETSPRV